MKIGLISDTHSYIDSNIIQHFNDCDEIWHAGDIGSKEVSDELQKAAPLKAVWGNIDDAYFRNYYSENEIFERENLKILIRHIAGTPPKYNTETKRLIDLHKPDILICGHSHILRVMHDKANQNLLYINPGAAGKHGFHKVRTIILFEINNGKISNMKAVELGKRA